MWQKSNEKVCFHSQEVLHLKNKALLEDAVLWPAITTPWITCVNNFKHFEPDKAQPLSCNTFAKGFISLETMAYHAIELAAMLKLIRDLYYNVR